MKPMTDSDMLAEILANTRAIMEWITTVQNAVEGMKASPMHRMIPGLSGTLDAFTSVKMS